MEKKKSVDKMKKKVHSTEAIGSEDSEYKFCTSSLRSLIKDPSFAKHRKTLEDVTKVFDKVHENWKKSKTRNQRLESEIASNVSKIKAALQLSEEDKTTIDTLKEELEKAWQMADEMRSKSTSNRPSSFPDVHRTSESAELERQAKTIDDLRGDKIKLEMSLREFNSQLKCRADTVRQLESKLKSLEEQRRIEKSSDEDRYALMSELESGRLRVFELEEEMAAKDKRIEDLVEESERRVKDLGEKDREICFLKTKEGSKDAKTSMATMTDSDFQEELQKLEAQEQKRIKKDKRMINLEGKLSNKHQLLAKARARIKDLSLELKIKSEEYRDLMDDCNVLREELKKSRSTIRELELVRDRNVCGVAQLEVQAHELKRELAEIRHCKYPEEIERLEEELDDFKRRAEEEKENLVKKSAIVNETRDLGEQIRNKIKVAVTVVDSFENRKDGVSTFGRVFRKPVDESAGDLLSLFDSLVNYLVEMCKDLTAENRKLNAEVESSRLLQVVHVKELEYPETSQVCSVMEQVVVPKKVEPEKLGKEKVELKKLADENICKNRKSVNVKERVSRTVKIPQISEDDETNSQDQSPSSLAEDHEVCDIPEDPVQSKKNPVTRQRSWKKPSDYQSSPEWKKFKDQVKLKTRKLNGMEANVEVLSKLSISRATEKQRSKRKAPSSCTINSSGKSFKKQ